MCTVTFARFKATGASITFMPLNYKNRPADSLDDYSDSDLTDMAPVAYAELASESVEIGSQLLKDHPWAAFSATYYDACGRRWWTLRSRQYGFNCASLAECFGGSGIQSLAIFSTEL